MRKSGIVIGLGEVGMPLYLVLRKAYPDTDSYDIRDGKGVYGEYDVLNICIPYSKIFVDLVRVYREALEPLLIINHSTVPVGTTSQIENAVHSPILGDHTNMLESLCRFPKWIGGPSAEKAEVYLSLAGIMCRTVAKSEETELLKLMCLAKYGMSITFAQYQKECFDKYGFDYAHILEWDMNYNNHVKPAKHRPILNPPGNKIEGHCVIPGTKMLNNDFSNPILEEVIKYE